MKRAFGRSIDPGLLLVARLAGLGVSTKLPNAVRRSLPRPQPTSDSVVLGPLQALNRLEAVNLIALLSGEGYDAAQISFVSCAPCNKTSVTFGLAQIVVPLRGPMNPSRNNAGVPESGQNASHHPAAFEPLSRQLNGRPLMRSRYSKADGRVSTIADIRLDLVKHGGRPLSGRFASIQ